jgi:hypothetical protein
MRAAQINLQIYTKPSTASDRRQSRLKSFSDNRKPAKDRQQDDKKKMTADSTRGEAVSGLAEMSVFMTGRAG